MQPTHTPGDGGCGYDSRALVMELGHPWVCPPDTQRRGLGPGAREAVVPACHTGLPDVTTRSTWQEGSLPSQGNSREGPQSGRSAFTPSDEYSTRTRWCSGPSHVRRTPYGIPTGTGHHQGNGKVLVNQRRLGWHEPHAKDAEPCGVAHGGRLALSEVKAGTSPNAAGVAARV